MSTLQYIPHHKLGTKHIGKPMKLVLKNGKVIYGVIKELHQKGIVFIPVQVKKERGKAKAQWFFPLFPIFLPFLFFIPFLFFCF
ncbi:hypothetical protein MK805_03335 [Shimazuella sp. AN120528]|uniref:hypothetical protein n=1 Tax=Shimazuella soli TaxID=1892854 RepID=UPI001F0FBA9A|nr:hypothetical protein [Shimazuella soli]MCH5583996.1 hypothetical protein [Shimazuella soli]